MSTAQREKILAVRGGGAEYDEREFRMQDLVWRRLVETEAQRQKEDIAILKAEVPTKVLRDLTFLTLHRRWTVYVSELSHLLRRIISRRYCFSLRNCVRTLIIRLQTNLLPPTRF